MLSGAKRHPRLLANAIPLTASSTPGGHYDMWRAWSRGQPKPLLPSLTAIVATADGSVRYRVSPCKAGVGRGEGLRLLHDAERRRSRNSPCSRQERSAAWLSLKPPYIGCDP